MSSAQGNDRSAFQAVYPWAGLDFGFAKATNGLGLIDPAFAANWANLASEGKPRGAYHELTATSSAAAQAAFFVATVRSHGLRALDMLAVVASDYPGVTGADVKTFCDTVRRLVGPHCPVLVYTDPAVAPILGSCTGYPLWVAAYQATAPNPAPWKTWRFWQWTDSPVDKDAFNGTADDLHAWLQTYAAAPKPPAKPTPPPPPPEDDMTFQLTGTDSTIPVPWGMGEVRLACSAPQAAPCVAQVGFLNHWAKESPVKLAEGLGVKSVQLVNDQLRIVLPKGWDLKTYPVTVTFDPKPAKS